MQAVAALEQLGGAAARASLLRLTSVAQLRSALRRGEVTRVRRGHYCLTSATRSLRVAATAGGLVSHVSAAQLHGWEVVDEPDRPWVTVPRTTRARPAVRCHVRWRDLTDEPGPVTSPLRTVVDCARELPFASALAIADSALRAGHVDSETLQQRAAEVRGRGAAAARRVTGHATGRAMNPFESLLRALTLESGREMEPQGAIVVRGVTVHPDLVDRALRLAVEAESWEWHGGREAFDRDCWRYTALTADGWTVLRFTWWQVRHDPGFVRDCLCRVSALAEDSVGRRRVLR